MCYCECLWRRTADLCTCSSVKMCFFAAYLRRSGCGFDRKAQSPLSSDSSPSSSGRTPGDRIGDVKPPAVPGCASVPPFSRTRLKLLPEETSCRRPDQMSKLPRLDPLDVEDYFLFNVPAPLSLCHLALPPGSAPFLPQPTTTAPVSLLPDVPPPTFSLTCSFRC